MYVALNDSVVPALKKFLVQVLNTDDYGKYIQFLLVRNDIATYYSRVHVFLSPSREEGFTYSVVEAAYCGNRVILSKCPGQDDYQNFNIPVFSWVDDPNQADITKQVADQILYLSQMPEEEKKRTTAAARDYMIKEFSMDKWVENILAVYNRA